MVAFIILHYKNLKDTIECIESLKKIDGDKKIVVVDNNSTTKKEQEEILRYTEDLILLKENIGFAKGNNEGCKYAIKKYKPDFLCVINSDTIVNQKDFINEINTLYKNYNFDILGPKILPDDYDSCNPFKAYKSVVDVERRIKYTKRLIKIYKNSVLRFFLEKYLVVKNLFRRKISNTNGVRLQLDVPLHGCALIFSKKYYSKFQDIFYPNTFLFHEEEFLYLRCQQHDLISLYSPSIEIYHKEGQSLNKTFNNKKYESLIFRNKEILKSLELLKKEMMENEKRK